MGLPGYYIFNAAVMITLVGSSIGTMVCFTFGFHLDRNDRLLNSYPHSIR